MSWINEIDQIRNDVSNHRVLLSSTLLSTAQVVRNVVQPGIVFWLNREVVGYDKSDCEFVVKSGEQWIFLARNVVAPWGRPGPNGAFIAKGSANAVLTDGIQQIETALGNIFDISIFEQGQRELIDRTIKSSNCDMEKCFVPYYGCGWCAACS